MEDIKNNVIPFKVSLEDAQVKTAERSKGRLKLTIKLSSDEAEAFKSFRDIVKPASMPDETFYKQVFFVGLTTLDNELRAMVQKEMEKLKAESPEAVNPISNSQEPQTSPSV
jgi:hypothetical protein